MQLVAVVCGVRGLQELWGGHGEWGCSPVEMGTQLGNGDPTSEMGNPQEMGTQPQKWGPSLGNGDPPSSPRQAQKSAPGVLGL